MKVGIYCRVNNINEIGVSSLKNQQKIGIDFCESKGYEFEIYNEIESGGKVEKKELNKLYSKLINKELGGIFVCSWDRLGRDKKEIERFKELINKYDCKIFIG
jgi:site-specific DNA recombinase